MIIENETSTQLPYRNSSKDKFVSMNFICLLDKGGVQIFVCFLSVPGARHDTQPTKTSPFILQPKKEKFQVKNLDIFHISTQNIDCGYSLEPPRF